MSVPLEIDYRSNRISYIYALQIAQRQNLIACALEQEGSCWVSWERATLTGFSGLCAGRRRTCRQRHLAWPQPSTHEVFEEQIGVKEDHAEPHRIGARKRHQLEAGDRASQSKTDDPRVKAHANPPEGLRLHVAD